MIIMHADAMILTCLPLSSCQHVIGLLCHLCSALQQAGLTGLCCLCLQRGGDVLGIIVPQSLGTVDVDITLAQLNTTNISLVVYCNPGYSSYLAQGPPQPGNAVWSSSEYLRSALKMHDTHWTESGGARQSCGSSIDSCSVKGACGCVDACFCDWLYMVAQAQQQVRVPCAWDHGGCMRKPAHHCTTASTSMHPGCTPTSLACLQLYVSHPLQMTLLNLRPLLCTVVQI